MEATVVLPIEAHTLDARHGDICERCLAADLTTVAIDLVRFTDDAIHDLGHYLATECGTCGASDLTR